MQKVLLTDPLTGLYTRATLPLRLQEEAERAGRYQESFSILIIDLDYFKSINDAFGHTRGDQVLVEFSQHLQSLLRGSDILYRYGGDEFVLLLPKTNKQQAIALCTRILNAIRDLPVTGNPPLNLSLSLGVATYPEDGLIPEEIFEKADLRCFASKQSGRARFTAEDEVAASDVFSREPGRPIERDQEQLSLVRFLNHLGEAQRGALFIDGPTCSGRSYFLIEASKLARLLGYEVLSLHCTPALQMRYQGVLAEACIQIGQTPPYGPHLEFEQQMAERLVEKDRTGLFFIVDNLHHADWATLEMLHHLLLHSNLPRVGIAYTLEQIQSPREINFGGLPILEQINLRPFSPCGVRIWLRSALQWEPPEPFSNWLHQQTGGLPADLQHSLLFLFKRNVLKKTGSGWEISPDFASRNLQDWLVAQRQPVPHNLPTTITTFVGRQYEIWQVKDILANERLLTILGPGGMGKTRLARQAAAELMQDFPDGVYILHLASLQAGTPLVSSLAEAIKYVFFSQQDPRIQLLNYLREKKMLLVMDNLEHILDSAGLVADILQEAPGIKIIATSRERLNLRGEALLELQGMGVQPGENIQSVGRQNAIRLFVINARRAQPSFALNEENADTISEICQFVAGLPLGIELAAAWVRMLSPAEILAELKQNLDFLSSEQRDLPDRHRSLRAVFDSSWNLLSPQEQQALRRLAAFQRGFRREAALSITGTSLSILSALVDKSLLYRVVPGRENPGALYQLHEVLRQYALEKLEQDPAEAARIFAQHASFFAGYLHKRQEQLRIGQQNAVREVDAELDDIRRAWQYALSTAQLDLCASMLEGLSQIYRIHGYYSEGKDNFKKAAQVFSNLPATTVEQQSSRDFLVARLLLRQAVFDLLMGDVQASREALDRSVPAIQSSQDVVEQARCRMHMGSLEDFSGHFLEAQQYIQQAVELFTSASDQAGIAACYNKLGLIAESLGNFAQARELLWESLHICRRLGDQWGSSRALTNLGNVECELGNLDQGRHHYQEALELGRCLGDEVGAAVLLNNLGDTARELEDFDEARKLLWQSFQAYDQVGDRIGKVIALYNLGEIAIRQGELERAERILSQALQISNEIEHPQSRGYVLKGLGALAQLRGDAAQAYHYLELALRAALASQSPPFMFETLEQLAEYYLYIQQPQRAARALVFVQRSSTASSHVRGVAARKLEALRSQFDAAALKELQDQVSQHSIESFIEEILSWQATPKV